MKILAIDPSLSLTGAALIKVRGNKLEILDTDFVSRDEIDWYDQCQKIVKQLEEVYKGVAFDTLAIEEPIFSWGRRNPQGFFKQSVLVGMLLNSALITIPDFSSTAELKNIALINPKTMKLVFTKDGKAKKDAIIEKARHWYSFPETRKVQREAIADAIGIGYTFWRFAQRPQNFKGVTLI